MPDQRIEDAAFEDLVSESDRDRNVLNLMLDDSWPWSVDEIARELQDRIGAHDSVSRLAEAGLVHRLGEFVFPSRTARRADQLGVGGA
jgi:predicted transcriptional regulator